MRQIFELLLECAPGMPVAMCASDPCANAVCHGHRSATCVPSYCGGCGFVFYDSNGDKLSCQGEKCSCSKQDLSKQGLMHMDTVYFSHI